MNRRRIKNRSRKNSGALKLTEGANRANRSNNSVSHESVPNKRPTANPKNTNTSDSLSFKDQAHAKRVSETLANVERLLSQANHSGSMDASDWLEASLRKTQNRLSDQLSKFTQSFEKRFNELQRTISESLDSQAVAQINRQDNAPSKGDAPVDASDEPDNEWERRKREMYAKYVEDSPATTKCSTEDTSEPENVDNANPDNCEGDELASLQESLHDSIESLDDVQAEEIEELRSQLTAKLREAEVELSINRAKLDQRKAEIERRQSELDRREKALENKYVDVNGEPQKMGVLDRLTRHLSTRKQSDSL